MADRLKKIPQMEVLMNLMKFLENPIPLINQSFIDMEDDSYRVNLGGVTKTIMTKDPALIQYILQKNNKNYNKSILQTQHLAEFIGTGLLTANGDYWLKQRRLIQPGFHKKSLDSFVRIMNQEILRFTEELSQAVDNKKGDIIMLGEMSKLTLTMVSKTLFSTGIKEDEIALFGSRVDTLQAAVVKSVRQPLLAWWRKINGENTKNKKVAKDLYAQVIQIINDRKNSDQEYGDILDMLLSAKYEGTEEGMTQQQLLDECLILFAAGYETTANALSWTFYLLDQHRDKLQLVLDEIANNELDANNPLESIMKWDYIRQVTSEVMRLYPPAWIIDRVPIEQDEFEGVELSPDEMINLYIYGVHHDAKHWDNPEEFRPSRFEKDKLKQIKPYTYFPFGGGPRLCIGQQFAMMELQLVVYTLLKKFDFTLEEQAPVKIKPGVTLRPKSGIKMKISKRI